MSPEAVILLKWAGRARCAREAGHWIDQEWADAMARPWAEVIIAAGLE